MILRASPALDAVLLVLLAGVTFAASYAISRRYFSTDRPLLAAGLVTLALVAGTAWPFSQRIGADPPENPSTAPHVAGLTVGDTVDGGSCRGTIDSQGSGAIDEITQKSDGIYVRGWAATPDKSTRVDELCAIVDGRASDLDTHYGSPRPDVANVFRNSALGLSGFSFTVAAGTGSHTISLVSKHEASVSVVGTGSIDTQ